MTDADPIANGPSGSYLDEGPASAPDRVGAPSIRGIVARLQPHLWIRYAPVVKYLRERFPNGTEPSVLEVGSGGLGVTRFWRRPVTGVDLRFDGANLGYLTRVVASATSLPFEGGEFECGVSIDVLEHLGETDRTAAVAEMLRVCAGDLLLAVPCAPEARDADRWATEICAAALAASSSERRTIEIERRSSFLREHEAAGYMTEADMRALIGRAAGRSDMRIEVWGNESVRAWRYMLPAVVPLRPWTRVTRRVAGMVALPWLTRSAARGFYRRFFLVRRHAGPRAGRPENGASTGVGSSSEG